MQKNQVDIQVDNQVDFNLNNFITNNSENIVCNIYKEQFDLINQLPEQERLKVLYLAVLNAFCKEEENNKKNQVENQVDYTYISISTSIYNSLSNYSKVLIKLLDKTLICKNYKNWGGKRNKAGRPKKEESIPDNQQLYGEYNNVCLTGEQYSKLLGICASQKLLDSLIDDLSKNIGRGKVEPYSAKYPDAHFIQLRAYYDYRRKYPDKFKEEIQSSNIEWYEKEKARLAAKGYK